MWKVRAFVFPHPRFDVAVIPLSRESQSHAAKSLAVDRLYDSTLVTYAKAVKKHEVHLSIDTTVIEKRGAELESGEFPSMNDLAAGESYVVHFCDPNATKALHTGHLRNIALGNAIASALAYAGATVQRRSVVGDAGRNMAEAIAALWPIKDTISSELAWGAEKPDHLVGRYYAREAGADRGAAVATVDAPLAREVVMRHDLADEMLAQMLRRAGEAIPAWHAVRNAVVAAQMATLANLGIEFDEIVLESAFVQEACAIAARGVEDGLFVRKPDGAIVYETGRADFASVPLVRPDGAPTQHMRTLAYWVLANAELEGSHLVRVCGEEWRPHALSTQSLISHLLHKDSAEHEPATIVFHRMVTMGHDVVKSSKGSGLLIDDLLEQIAAETSSAVRSGRFAGSPPAGLCPASIGALVALGFFLTRPPGVTVELDPGSLLSARDSLGWLLVLASAQESLPATSSYEAGGDPAYRFAVLQAEVIRHHLQLIVARYDVVAFARYLQRLARWYLQRQRDARVFRVVSSILNQGSVALGLSGPGR